MNERMNEWMNEWMNESASMQNITSIWQWNFIATSREFNFCVSPKNQISSLGSVEQIRSSYWTAVFTPTRYTREHRIVCVVSVHIESTLQNLESISDQSSISPFYQEPMFWRPNRFLMVDVLKSAV